MSRFRSISLISLICILWLTGCGGSSPTNSATPTPTNQLPPTSSIPPTLAPSSATQMSPATATISVSAFVGTSAPTQPTSISVQHATPTLTSSNTPPLTPLASDAPVPALPLKTVADIPLTGGSSRFDYLSLDSQTGLLFIAHLGASIVSVFDTKAGKIVADIPDVGGVHGVLAIPELGQVYASATNDNQVAVIDEKSFKVVARIPGGIYPDGLAYDPVEHQVFVSDESGGTDTVIDTVTEARINTIQLGGEAGNTQYDPVSGHIFVAVQTLNQVVEIDPANGNITRHIPLPGCQHSHSLLIDSPNRLAFVGCDENARLLVFDIESMNVIATYTVGDTPDVLTFDHNWHILYVASESGIVSMFLEQGRQLQKVGESPLAPGAHAVAVDSASHQVYFPLADAGAGPVLRIMRVEAPLVLGRSKWICV
jgi:YVTN family beta-propeller protein